MADDPNVIELLRRILEKLDSIETAKAARPSLSYQDFLILQQILPGIQKRFGIGGIFSVKELANDFRALAGGDSMNNSALGSLLYRSENQDLNGLRFIRVSKDHNANLWSLVESD